MRSVLGASVFVLLLSGCFSLDNSLFNQQKLSSYSLRTTVIPESSRTQVILTSQGKKIYGYFVASNGMSPGIVVLYNHGNKDHLQHYWDRVELLYQAGFNIFIYDYEGFGMSEGEPSESAVYADAAAAYNYVHSMGFADSSIVDYGYSLGGAAAIDLASRVFVPRRLITESAFASSTALVQSGTLVDVPSSYVMDGEYRNDEKIKNVHVPYLLLHGTDDTFIDIEKNSQVLYNLANRPKQFVRVSGANHTDIPDKLGYQNYIALIRTFVYQSF